MTTSRSREILFRFVMVLLPFIGLAAVEAGARLYSWAAYRVPGKRYGIWRPDPEFGAIHRANAYNSMGETNNWGFRNHEDVFDPKPPGSLRLIAYGGSTTFCYQLHADEAWPARLEQILRARRPGGGRDQVLNAGAVMWSIGQIDARARRDVPVLRPDYVLIYSGVNEAWNTILLAQEGQPMERLVAQGRFGVFSKRLDQASWFKRELFCYKLFARFIAPEVHALHAALSHAPAEEFPTAPAPGTLENYLHVLKDLIGLLKDNGAIPVFVVEITGDPTPVNLHLTAYSREGAKVAGAAGAIVIDPSPILEGAAGGPRSLFAESGVHFSEPGARRLADFLYDRILVDQRRPRAEDGPSGSRNPS